MEPEVVAFGVERVLENWREHPPDYIIVIRADLGMQMGFRMDGEEYGHPIVAWIMVHYLPIAGYLGREPKEVGPALMRRASIAAP
jgi:hypothetical protein